MKSNFLASLISVAALTFAVPAFAQTPPSGAAFEISGTYIQADKCGQDNPSALWALLDSAMSSAFKTPFQSPNYAHGTVNNQEIWRYEQFQSSNYVQFETAVGDQLVYMVSEYKPAMNGYVVEVKNPRLPQQGSFLIHLKVPQDQNGGPIPASRTTTDSAAATFSAKTLVTNASLQTTVSFFYPTGSIPTPSPVGSPLALTSSHTLELTKEKAGLKIKNFQTRTYTQGSVPASSWSTLNTCLLVKVTK